MLCPALSVATHSEGTNRPGTLDTVLAFSILLGLCFERLRVLRGVQRRCGEESSMAKS